MPDINNFREKSFDFAADVSKQLITLSTAIITVTITFSKDVLGGAVEYRYWLLAAWIAFIFTILCGIWTLMALTGTLEPIENSENGASINGKNIRFPAILQILFFIAALALTITYGFKSINEDTNDKKSTENVYNREFPRVIKKSLYTIEPNEVIDTLMLK